MSIIQNSFFFKIVKAIIEFFSKIIKESYIYNFFTKEVDRKKIIEDSFINKVLNGVIGILRKIFYFLKLDKIFTDSIFAKPYIWVGMIIFLIPYLPTMIIVCLVWASIISLIIKVCLNKECKLKYVPVNIWVGVFILIYVFSAITSVAVNGSIKISAVVCTFILFYFVVVNSIKSRKQINVILYILMISATIVSLIGICQYILGSESVMSWIDSNMFESIKLRVYSTFENPNVLGEYLLFIIPITISLFFLYKSFWNKFITAVCTAIMMLCLILTYSRGCYLGLIFSLGVFAILINFKYILLLFVGLISLPFVLPKTIITRFMSIGNLKDSSTSYRVSIWRSTLKIIKDYRAIHIGQGSEAFKKVFVLYAENGVIAPHSHNFYLQIIVELGILGGLCFFMIIIRLLQYLLSGIKKLNQFKDKVVVIGFISGLSGYMLQGMFDNTWYNYKLILMFWAFIGLGVISKDIFLKDDIKLLN